MLRSNPSHRRHSAIDLQVLDGVLAIVRGPRHRHRRCSISIKCTLPHGRVRLREELVEPRRTKELVFKSCDKTRAIEQALSLVWCGEKIVSTEKDR